MNLVAVELRSAILLPWVSTIGKARWDAGPVTLELLPSGYVVLGEPGGRRRRMVPPSEVLWCDALEDDRHHEVRAGMAALEERLLRERLVADACQAFDAFSAVRDEDDEDEDDDE